MLTQRERGESRRGRAGSTAVSRRLRERQEWKFFGALPKADRSLATAWWTLLGARGVLPAVFAVAMGARVGAVQRGEAMGGPLLVAGAAFVLLQVLTPVHQTVSYHLGDRTAAWLYDRLTAARGARPPASLCPPPPAACVEPPGMGHLEDETLTSALPPARDFDLGMTGPP